MKKENRIYLSPPHMGGEELRYVKDVFDSNWIAPAGPDILEFEKCICNYTGARHSVAVSSGTAAIHLSLIVSGIKPGDDVFCSSFTFAGSVFPVTYTGANLVLIDSEKLSWNIDTDLLSEAILKSKKNGRRPKAVIVVHLYGQSANLKDIEKICSEHELVLIEDAAESLGALFKSQHTGTIGDFGVYSFNGNKIITTSGGGMLVGKSRELIEKARYLSTQARDPFPYYHHTQTGYNYRMSNVSAAIGRGQMEVLQDRVNRKREIYSFYREFFNNFDGITMLPNDIYGRSNCWLSCILIDSKKTGLTPESIRLALEAENIESRPLWKPMHLQPVFKDCSIAVNGVSENLFNSGLCLPSGTNMTVDELTQVTGAIRKLLLQK